MAERRMACGAMALAIGGVATVIGFFALNHWMVVVRDDIVWEEGLGFIAFLIAMAMAVFLELVGLALAQQVASVPVGRAAGRFAITVLAGAGAFLAWVLFSLRS